MSVGFFGGSVGATPPAVAIRTTKSTLLKRPASDLDLGATNSQGIFPASGALTALTGGKLPTNTLPSLRDQLGPPKCLPRTSPLRLFSSASGAFNAHWYAPAAFFLAS